MFYKRLLVSLLGDDAESLAEREKLNLDCFEMLKKLQEVDPTRKMRYIDLGERCCS